MCKPFTDWKRILGIVLIFGILLLPSSGLTESLKDGVILRDNADVILRDGSVVECRRIVWLVSTADYVQCDKRDHAVEIKLEDMDFEKTFGPALAREYAEIKDDLAHDHAKSRRRMEADKVTHEFSTEQTMVDSSVEALQTSETYTGTGIFPGYKSGIVSVRILYNNSPASRAGVRLGDRIISINDETDFRDMLAVASTLSPGKHNPSFAEKTIKLTVLSNNRPFTFTLRSEIMPLEPSMLPQSDIPPGKVLSVTENPRRLVSSYTPADGIVGNDTFYVVKGSLFLGKARFSNYENDRALFEFTGKATPSELTGSNLHLFMSVKDFNDYKKHPSLESPEEYKARRAEKNAKIAAKKPGELKEYEKIYEKYERLGLQKNWGEVISHEPGQMKITVKVRVGSTKRPLPMTRPNYMDWEVTDYYKNIDIYYQRQTPTLPLGILSEIERRDTIRFFYDEKNGKYHAAFIEYIIKD